jgi:hypothetical protein
VFGTRPKILRFRFGSRSDYFVTVVVFLRYPILFLRIPEFGRGRTWEVKDPRLKLVVSPLFTYVHFTILRAVTIVRLHRNRHPGVTR